MVVPTDTKARPHPSQKTLRMGGRPQAEARLRQAGLCYKTAGWGTRTTLDTGIRSAQNARFTDFTGGIGKGTRQS